MKYYSVHYNRPDFIKIQKQFIDGELIVINNHCSYEIEETCKELNIKYFNLKNPYSLSMSHGYALNFLKTIIDYSDDYCIIDHDLFPYKPINFEKYDIIGCKSNNNPNIPYLWPGFLAIKKEIKLDNINFYPGLIHNGDTGCDTHNLIKKIGIEKIHFCKEEYLGIKTNEYFQTSPILSKFDDYCIHYLNGSNWMKTNTNVINEKNCFLLTLLKKLNSFN